MKYLESASPQFATEIVARRYEHDALSQAYQAELDGVIGGLAANMMNSGRGANPNAIDAWEWRIDGDITDGRFDHATRLTATFIPADKINPADNVSDVLTDKLYTPQNKWNRYAHDLGKSGLYVTGLRYRTVPLEESVLAPPKYARFTHKYGTNVTCYKADPTAGQDITFPSLLPFNQIIEDASCHFLQDHAQDALNNTVRRLFADATEADCRSNTAPIPDLNAFRSATANHNHPYQRVSQLARTLYDAGKDLSRPSLLNELLSPDAAEAARWGLLDKNSYHTEKTGRSEHTFLTARLRWVEQHAPILRLLLIDRIAANLSDFSDQLGKRLDENKRVVHGAALFRAYLEPPHTHSLNNDVWSVVPR